MNTDRAFKNYSNNALDLDAKHYVKNSNLQRTIASKLIAHTKISKNAEILDVGCGDGRNTAELALKAPNGNIVGIDASNNMIHLASETFSDVKNLHFYHKKAENLSYPSSKFDLIVSFSCFHWIHDAKEVLQKLSSFLKPGGQLLILTYPKESKYYEIMQKSIENFEGFSGLTAYSTMLSSNEYKTIIEKCGLRINKFEINELFTNSKNVREEKNFIKGWLSSFVGLPNRWHENYLNLIISNAEPYMRKSTDGAIHLPYTELIISATKP